MKRWWSKCTPEYVDYADEWGGIPFDCDGSIDFVVPEAGAGDVESTVGFLHDDAIGYEFEILIDVGDAFKYLG